MKARLLTVCAMILAAGSSRAQNVPPGPSAAGAEKPYVQAAGDATISVKPDQAVMDIGVVSQAPTAAAAAGQNARQTAAVLADMNRLLGSGGKVRTASYSVRPNYQAAKPGATPSITGYTATNVVEVTVDDLDLVSKILDAATGSGANVIQNLQYQLKDPSVVRAQALRQAAEKARTAAEAMAAGLGVKVVRILSAEEGAGSRAGFPVPRMFSAQAGQAPPTPVEAGTIDVSATVTVRAEIMQ